MRVVINQDENNNEVEIVINCKIIDDNIVKIIEKLREEENIITGVKDSKVHIIKPENVLYLKGHLYIPRKRYMKVILDFMKLKISFQRIIFLEHLNQQ